MIATVPKEIYLKILDVCKKSRLVVVNDETVLIDFDVPELNDLKINKALKEIFKGYGNGK